jgi:hypothetical protein
MGRKYGLFNDKELSKLRGKELDILRDAVRDAIKKSPLFEGTFRKYDSETLRKKVLPLYKKLAE